MVGGKGGGDDGGGDDGCDEPGRCGGAEVRPPLRLGLCLAAFVAPAAGEEVNGPSKPGAPHRPPPVVGAETGAAAPPSPGRGVIGGKGAGPAPPQTLTSEDGAGDYGYAGGHSTAPDPPSAGPPLPSGGERPAAKE